MLASGKAGAAEHYRGDPVFRVVLPLVPDVCDRHPDIRRAVERAAARGVKRGRFRAAGDDTQAV